MVAYQGYVGHMELVHDVALPQKLVRHAEVAHVTDRKDEFDKTVVSMHVRPYADQFNNNVARVFHRYVTEFPGIQFCTAAHEHHVFEENLFEDGIMYYMSDCMKNRNYYVFTITPEGYEREVVYF